jgi:hypothetical protein
MSALVTLTGQIANCKRGAAATQLMAFCRAVTPAFYKNKTDLEVEMEKASIELLTAGIDNAVLAKMCELAVLNYPSARGLNDKTYFDINYVLTFYRQAFMTVWHDGVDLPKNAECIANKCYPEIGVLEETWATPDGQTYTIKCFCEFKREGIMRHYYSPKLLNRLVVDVDDVKF